MLLQALLVFTFVDALDATAVITNFPNRTSNISKFYTLKNIKQFWSIDYYTSITQLIF